MARLFSFVLVVLGGVMTAAEARAESPSPCDVQLDGGALPERWASAMRDVSGVVATLTTSTTDCRKVVVSPAPEGGGAVVLFTTADGRTARREVSEPGELLSTVEALLVVGSDFASDVAATAPAVEPPTAAVAPMEIPAAPDATPAHHTKGNALLVGASGGMKSSWPHDSVTPTAELFAGVASERWELAGFARVEVEHDAEADADVNAPSGKLRYSAVGGGVKAGHRYPLTSSIVLVGGVHASMFDAEEERTGKKSDHHAGHHDVDVFDPRTGLYAGAVVAASSRFRVRAQVDGDAGLVAHQAVSADLPALPRWTLGFSLGMEAAFLQ